MAMMRSALRVAALCIFLFAGPGFTKDKPWFKYENAYFEAYSDASDKKVRDLLKELENFRAAISQVVNIDIPPGAAKTQVIIFNAGRDFRDVTDSRLVDAFALGLRGIPYIVMPASVPRKWSKVAIRHEYTHVILAYGDYIYPDWYQEGFAEFMSGTTFREKDTKFTIGEAIGRQRTTAPWVDWDELMSGEFEFHGEDSGPTLSNAYLQSWLLVHYLTLGEDLQHNENLARYIALYTEGKSSLDAFSTYFDMTPTELGRTVLNKYSRRSIFYIVDFERGNQDHEYLRSPVSRTDIQPVIDDIHEQLTATRE